MDNCIFCKIINKEIPSTIVYEDEWTLAFRDIKPVAPVHIIIVPKLHIASVNDLTEENAEAVARVHIAAKKTAEALGVAEKGYRLINNCGADAGQTVFHLHYHLIAGVSLGEKLI